LYQNIQPHEGHHDKHSLRLNMWYDMRSRDVRRNERLVSR
jgi:hypothetical protein